MIASEQLLFELLSKLLSELLSELSYELSSSINGVNLNSIYTYIYLIYLNIFDGLQQQFLVILYYNPRHYPPYRFKIDYSILIFKILFLNSI